MARQGSEILGRQTFLQALQANSYMRDDKCKELYGQIFNKSAGECLFGVVDSANLLG